MESLNYGEISAITIQVQNRRGDIGYADLDVTLGFLYVPGGPVHRAQDNGIYPVLDENGNPVPATDENGNPIPGGNGGFEPLYRTTTNTGYISARWLVSASFPQNPAQKPGGGKTTDSAKLAVDPCAGVKVSDLDYSGEHFTERHILDTDPAYKDRSKYAYSPWFGLRLAGEPDPQKRLQMARQMVIDYDNWTFQGGGKYQSSPGSNIVFVYGFPKRSGPGMDVEWFTGFVGSNQLHAGELTNVNTLVLAPDCS
jgi:hypothetical protein